MRAAPSPSVLLLVVGAALLACGPQQTGEDEPPPTRVERIVSMNPSLTAMILALGGGDRLVGVDQFSARQHPQLAALPRVGGLYSPSLEAVAALRPDLVVLVPSFEQRSFRARLGELGVARLELDPLGFEDVLEALDRLGARIGRREQARARIEAIRRVRSAVEHEVRDRERPRAVLVLQRDPLFVVGRGSFLDDMLRSTGAENVAASFPDPWPRVSAEWLVGAAPELILDAAPGVEAARTFWSRWPSLPAVAQGRVVAVEAERVTLPGPWLDRALVLLAGAVHGPQVVAKLGPPR